MVQLGKNTWHFINPLYCSLVIFLLNGCSVWKKATSADLVDDFYKYNTGQQKEVFYLDRQHDTFLLYNTTRKNKQYMVDTSHTYKVIDITAVGPMVFSKSALDIDLLAIPFKLRASEADVPAQLNTNLNGAIFFGHKTDVYKVDYQLSPVKEPIRNINHFGFSIGIFSGIGNTAMTPTTTSNSIASEYDGIVWLKGVAGILAINKFSVGLTIGFDNLLDRNKDTWVYESKPWLGLALGLNLN